MSAAFEKTISPKRPMILVPGREKEKWYEGFVGCMLHCGGFLVSSGSDLVQLNVT